MAAKVFISYRREDSAGHAGRVHDRLVREFGSGLLFMDVDGIPLGVNFVKVLQEEVAKCSVLLAVMGHEWLNVRDEDGRRRLDNPDDFVRVEIAAALQRDIPVIPIMLEGTKVPKANQLPNDLQGLALRNGLGVRHSSFHTDMDILIRGLKGRLTEANEQRVQSLTPGADKSIWMDDGAGERDTTPNLRSAQKTTHQSDVKMPLHQVANTAVSAEQRAVVPTAPALSKIQEEVTNFSDESDKSIRKVIAAEPSDPRRPSAGVQHIAPRADVRSRNMLFIILAGIAIVVIGAASLMWPTISPRDSTTTVKPVTDTASVPGGIANDAVKSVTDSPSLLPGVFDSTIKGRVKTQAERDSDARGDELAAQVARIQSRLESRMNAAQPDFEKIQEDMRALSKLQEEMSKLLDENDKKAREAIKSIKEN